MYISEDAAERLRSRYPASGRMTKKSIEDALFSLMKEKEYGKISITEIINRSGISRSAFYHSFKSKEEILDEAIREVIRDVLLSLTKTNFSNWLQVFRISRESKDQYTTLIQAGFEYRVYTNLLGFEEYVDSEDALALRIWAGIIYSVVTDWAKRGMTETNEEMAFKTLLSLNRISEITQKQ